MWFCARHRVAGRACAVLPAHLACRRRQFTSRLGEGCMFKTQYTSYKCFDTLLVINYIPRCGGAKVLQGREHSGCKKQCWDMIVLLRATGTHAHRKPEVLRRTSHTTRANGTVVLRGNLAKLQSYAVVELPKDMRHVCWCAML